MTTHGATNFTRSKANKIAHAHTGPRLGTLVPLLLARRSEADRTFAAKNPNVPSLFALESAFEEAVG